MKEFLIEWMKNDYPKARTFIQRECNAMAEDYAKGKMGECDYAVIYSGTNFDTSWIVNP